ncbi:hypothetical protein ACFLXT_00365 [Chloroflexota bacterium]
MTKITIWKQAGSLSWARANNLAVKCHYKKVRSISRLKARRVTMVLIKERF